MKEKDFKDLKKSIQQMKDIQTGKLRPRRTWIINPSTKIKENKKFSESLTKKEIRDLLKKEDY